MLRRLSVVLVVAVFGAACSGASGSSAADLNVSDARLGVPAGADAALYFVIQNDGGTDAVLSGVEVDVTEMASLHEVQIENGLSKMVELADGAVVPAGGSLVFEPGGMHAMLMNVSTLDEGMVVEVTLMFEEVESITVSADVVGLAELVD